MHPVPDPPRQSNKSSPASAGGTSTPGRATGSFSVIPGSCWHRGRPMRMHACAQDWGRRAHFPTILWWWVLVLKRRWP
eukprot:7539060-Pyramimonas_sp.AAC.1